MESVFPHTHTHTLSLEPLPPLPVKQSIVAIRWRQVVFFGSMKQVKAHFNSIHQLVHGEWVKIGSMINAKHCSLVVSPSPDMILIVGEKVLVL